MNPSDIAIVLPEKNPADIFRKVGGKATSVGLSSEVDFVFQPGLVYESDSSDEFYDQYRKLFLRNLSETAIARSVKLYGYNTRSNTIIKFSLEKNTDGIAIVDGSEEIANYLTPPGVVSDYVFTELQSDEAIDIGNSGVLDPGQRQGIWLRMRIPRDASELASDDFVFGILYTDLGS
jgi:hypothetical protein